MRSLGKIIPISVIVVIILCINLDSIIKKTVMKNSIDEDLVKYLITGSYIDLSGNSDIILTNDNIESVTINDVYISSSIFGTSASVSYTVDISTNELYVFTNGLLKLTYSPDSPCKWGVDSSWINKHVDLSE